MGVTVGLSRRKEMQDIKQELDDYIENDEKSYEKRRVKRNRPDPMSNSMVYTIWNTKGGVGKSTLTFHCASQYAKTHPDRRVLVIDMCPQANVSTALLGSAANPNSSCLECIRNDLVKEESEEEELEFFKSISGIILNRTQLHVQDWDPTKYLVKINEYNEKMSSNLYLLLGDPTLEIMKKEIDKIRAGGRTVGGRDPWKYGTLIVRKIIEKIAQKCQESGVGLTVFIDTNPAFSVYTECAVAAADRLIIPVNADDFSHAACKSMLGCIYGGTFDTSYDHPMLRHMREEVFAYRALAAGLKLPKIHLVINNRVTIYNLRASKTFKEMGNVILNRLWRAYRNRPEIFTQPETAIRTKEEFEENYNKELNDFHQTAVHSIHAGAPLYALNYGPSTTLIGELRTPINKATLEGYRRKLEEIVRML